MVTVVSRTPAVNKYHPCLPRKRFTSEVAARAAASSISIRKKVQKYAVPCGQCNGWHIS